MQARRFELAAWIVHECGKPWREADGDVAEAIDFCRYYAASARELPRAGSMCRARRIISSTWARRRGGDRAVEFSTAILTGMTVAALVTGNTVIMKPAEQSPLIAARLYEILREAGIPSDVVHYLPVTARCVAHGSSIIARRVDCVHGSRQVGLAIHRARLRSLRRAARKSQTGHCRDGGQERDHCRRRCRSRRGGCWA